MKPVLKLSLLGVASYLVFLVLLTPVAKVFPWLQPHFEDIELYGAQGSVWFGQAALIESDLLRLQDVHWNWQPGALLTGHLEFSLQANLDGQAVQTHIGTSLLGNQYLSHVQGLVSADELLYWLDIRGAELQGMLDLQLDHVQWGAGQIPLISGRIRWSPATLMQPISLSLGVVDIQMQPSEDGSAGTLEAKEGVLQAIGELALSSDGVYRINADIKKNGTVPQAVSGFLDTFTESSNGVYKLEWSDSL